MNPYNTRAAAPAKSREGRAATATDAFKIRAREVAELEQVWQRMVLHLLRTESLRAPWVMGVTSAFRGEGKSTNALGLALALTQETGEKVLVVETDFSNPTMMEDFRLNRQPCLADYLSNNSALEATFTRTAAPNLSILPAWNTSLGPSSAPAAAFSTALRHRMPDMLAYLRERFQYVFMDMAGLLEDVNTEDMARHMDGVLLVVRAGITPVEKVSDAVQLLDPHAIKGVIHVGPDSAMPGWLSNLIAE
jgi:non-specific protein-tyrosine kinase